MTWWDALVRAGAVPAAYVPPASMGRTDADDGAEPGADLVEGDAVAVHAVALAPPPPASFLDGIEHWKVVGYDGVLPVVRAYVAAAVRRRGPDRRLRTAFEASRGPSTRSRRSPHRRRLAHSPRPHAPRPRPLARWLRYLCSSRSRSRNGTGAASRASARSPRRGRWRRDLDARSRARPGEAGGATRRQIARGPGLQIGLHVMYRI